MDRSAIELADVFRRHGPSFRERFGSFLSHLQRRVMAAIESCRTARLGGHVDTCDSCGYAAVSYNSCRNRHCPKCQGSARAAWVAQREGDLLPVPYFHVVFTLPASIAELALQNKRLLYGLLFRITAETLLTIARDSKRLGAHIGFIAVLHTWGQNLLHHPHVHCVVPGGGLALDGHSWRSSRPKFFLPVRVLSAYFRRRFLAGLEAIFESGQLRLAGSLAPLRDPAAFAAWLAEARATRWVVYSKAPFGGPQQVLRYLGRYTHRVALSNGRLVCFDESTVSFRWKDYRDDNRQKVMTLSADEFIRRFLLHVLPRGFQRIRHYGLLANPSRARNLARCRLLLGGESATAPPAPVASANDTPPVPLPAGPPACPTCGEPLRRRLVLPSRLPIPARCAVPPRVPPSVGHLGQTPGTLDSS
jgi:hypothetical protein